MSAEHIVVGLSGGVDSAVAAYLLREQGYRVTGIFMKNWEDDDHDQYCSSRQDWIDAAAVADVLGIDLEAVNFAARYKERVFAEFLREYAAGRTPNPDVLCNAEIKFKAFLEHAQALGAERIATGHYARVRTVDGQAQLLRGVDPDKDQSYFLHRLTQAQLRRALFPVGELRKSEVRAIARRIGLPNAAKRDSTGICFIGERPFRAFLNRYLPSRPGPIRAPDGRVLGDHVGLAFYTLGQRKGIGVGGLRDGSGAGWFVARKDMQSNTLWVVQGHDHPWLLSGELDAQDASWIAGVAPAMLRAKSMEDALSAKAPTSALDAAPSTMRPGSSNSAARPGGHGAKLAAQTRYRQRPAACSMHVDGTRFRLRFDRPQWAVTPGQSAVLYDAEVCLGGGVIDSPRLPLAGEGAGMPFVAPAEAQSA